MAHDNGNGAGSWNAKPSVAPNPVSSAQPPSARVLATAQGLATAQVLSPAPTSLRGRLSAGLFSDANLEHLSHLLDDCFIIPGTRIRFGIDGIIGLVPFAGDILAGLLSSIIVLAAWFRGAPTVLLARMIANLAIDVLIGVVPLFGDAFDIAWKANRRNYALLSRHLAEPGQHGWRDWSFLVLILGVLLLLFALPLLVLGYLLALLTRHA